MLRHLGSDHALVVHGADGMDEISHSAETRVSELRNGEVTTYLINAEEFGIPRGTVSEILGGSAEENASVLLAVLEGRKGAPRDVVLLNAGAAIFVGGVARSLGEGVEAASDSIDSGRARRKLRDLVDASHSR